MTHNRLPDETSPYLLQHKDNPVHWWPWSPEAFEAARAGNKPILLSVGYAACHWCHVMAHESFEDTATAAVMNELFINIKVDREERPDVDTIYMSALHSLGEQGGWPLTMFLTPDAKPFWGGTYFPKDERFGRPSFTRVLQEISRIYAEEPAKVSSNASLIVERLREARPVRGTSEISPAVVAQAAEQVLQIVDPVNGGIRGAPKFPQFSLLWFLWRAGIRFGQLDARDAVVLTLRRICEGGIYDHLGGGFARYSVDERWLAPHFEKMLYDNALLLTLLTEAWRETREPLFGQRVRETIGWLEREMRLPGGAFSSSLDADSQGEEGRFYVWSEAEIRDVLGGEDAAFFAGFYDVSADGNWEGHTILNRLHLDAPPAGDDEARLTELRSKLFDARAPRERPGLDDKVLADWNGLLISALATAGFAFEEPDWIRHAEDAYQFITDEMLVDERLRHAWRGHLGSAPATAPDYANMIQAAATLFQYTNKPGYLEDAKLWTADLDEMYWNGEQGGYALTADDADDLIVRVRTAHDDATPNANGTMLTNLVALHLLTGEAAYLERAEALLGAFAGDVQANVLAHCGMLAGALDVFAPQEVTLAGADATKALAAVVRGLSLPGVVYRAGSDVTAGSPVAVGDAAGGMFCSAGSCSVPVAEPAAFEDLLRGGREVASIGS